MELRHLRYFVAAAEEVSFGRAARRLHISSPAIGVQIRELERELRTDLFERLPRGVRLTQAGTVLLTYARHVLGDVQEAVEQVARVGQAETGVLRVGHVHSSLLRRSGVGNLVAEFCVRYPKVEIQGQELTTAEQAKALSDGRIDVALSYTPPAAPGIETEVLDRHLINGALLPATHPLARKSPLHCADLSALPMLQGLRHTNPDGHDSMVRALRERGLDVKIDEAHQIPDAAVLFALIAAGAGWMAASPITAELLLITNPGVVFRQWVEPPVSQPYCIQWRSGDRSSLVSNFVALARELRDDVPPHVSNRADLHHATASAIAEIPSARSSHEMRRRASNQA